MAKKQLEEIGLLSALRFVSIAQRANGSDDEKFCMLVHNQAVAFNRLIAAGMPIAEDLRCCPQTHRLIAALEECSPGFQLSQEQLSLVVRSGEFVANVPLIDGSRLQWASPDPPQVTVDDKLKAALIAVWAIANEKSDRVHEAAILMQSGSCVSTNGTLILESWHGWDLPPNMLLPKAIIGALNKIKKPLVSVGFGASTVTFYFKDHSWIRSQRYIADWPKSNLLNTETHPRKLSQSIFKAAHQLSVFSEDGQLYCKDEQASSHPFFKPNAFDAHLRAGIEGVAGSRVYALNTLFAIEPFASLIDDETLMKRSFVYGVQSVKIGSKKTESIDVKMRGVFSHATEDDAAPPPPPVGNMETWNRQQTANGCGGPGMCDGKCNGTCLSINEDDIPF